MHLRVVTLNVWNEEGDPGRTELINSELRRIDPDLVALQEVVRRPDRDQLAELVAGTGLHATHETEVAGESPPEVLRYGGNAVATRWPHRVVEALGRDWDFPDAPWRPMAASVPLPDEGEVLFIATTTSYRLDAEAFREREALALADLDARHRTALPTIMAGDFNATPDASSIRFLTGRQSLAGRSTAYHDAWAVAGSGSGYTWSCGNPNTDKDREHLVRQPNHRRRIDYVFVGSAHAHPDARCRIRSATLAFDKPSEGIWPSDHFGVVVEVDIGAWP
jgi:endonuclease/exonuclease/phosphatase family metal-dependent hydrolase